MQSHLTMRESENTELKIESGIPIPKPIAKQGISATLRLLKVGDSVHIPGKKSVDMSSFIYAAKLSGKLTCRTDATGVRVWRIKE